ncbi:MAG TPA: hypothetical protein VK357_12410 [Rubrobacteraceae bacterium]|nr:hypothetical protein [Rubrobacteraceae bacterium]
MASGGSSGTTGGSIEAGGVSGRGFSSCGGGSGDVSWEGVFCGDGSSWEGGSSCVAGDGSSLALAGEGASLGL